MFLSRQTMTTKAFLDIPKNENKKTLRDILTNTKLGEWKNQ